MSVSEAEIDTNTKTILVIEDSDDLRSDVIEMLNLEGYTTYGAEDGVVGVELAREIVPDLIVCDIMMPRLNGYGVLQTLRSDNATSAIPFIFLTAKTEHMDQRHGMVLGAEDYLTKPFMVEELLESISAQLKKREDQLKAVRQRVESISNSIATALPHELRTPLNTVIGFSEMLQSEAQNLKPDQVSGWAQHIHSAGFRLYRLVENYLYFVQLQLAVQSHTPYEIEQAVYNLRSTIESQALSTAAVYKRENDLLLQLEDTPEFDIEEKDAAKMVEEIVDNAFKFSKEAHPVTVKGYNENSEYVLEVIDEGRGMTSEQIDQIGGFMQFERLHYEQQGMGLGLAVTKLLAEVYSFDFDIKSERDIGTTMTLRLKAK